MDATDLDPDQLVLSPKGLPGDGHTWLASGHLSAYSGDKLLSLTGFIYPADHDDIWRI